MRQRPRSVWDAAITLLMFVLIPLYTYGMLELVVETTNVRMITPACRYRGERIEAKRPCTPHPEVTILEPRLLARGTAAALTNAGMSVVVVALLFASMPLSLLSANALVSLIPAAQRSMDQAAREDPAAPDYATAQSQLRRAAAIVSAPTIIVAFAAAHALAR